jgi:hypothetical protein
LLLLYFINLQSAVKVYLSNKKLVYELLLLYFINLQSAVTDLRLVDSGRFRSSQQLTFSQDGSAAMLAWNVHYAIYLHQGHTLPDGTFVPGCPWTIIAMQNFGIAETMTILLQQELG